MTSYIRPHAATDCLETILYNLLTLTLSQIIRLFHVSTFVPQFYKTKIAEVAFQLMGTLTLLERLRGGLYYASLCMLCE